MNLHKPLLAYMTYPLSSDPRGNTKKAIALSLAIMAIFPTMTILLAHNSTQYTEEIEPHRSILADIQIIKNCDLVILGKPLDYSESSGCVWEYRLAQFFQKPIVTSDYLLGYSPDPLTWRPKNARIKNRL